MLSRLITRHISERKIENIYLSALCQVFFPVCKALHIDGFRQAPYFPFAYLYFFFLVSTSMPQLNGFLISISTAENPKKRNEKLILKRVFNV